MGLGETAYRRGFAGGWGRWLTTGQDQVGCGDQEHKDTAKENVAAYGHRIKPFWRGSAAGDPLPGKGDFRAGRKGCLGANGQMNGVGGFIAARQEENPVKNNVTAAAKVVGRRLDHAL